MPRGVLYTYPNCAIQLLVYPYAKKSRVRVGCMVTYRRGAFGVARFDLQGHSQEPQIVKRATVLGFTLEPKCKIYYPDNQIRNNGNSMD